MQSRIQLRAAVLLLPLLIACGHRKSAQTISLNSEDQQASWDFTTDSVNPADLKDNVSWKPVQVPKNIALPGANTIWYRAKFNAAPVTGTPGIRLGEISDRDRTYLNGVLIGETGKWDSPDAQAYDRQRIYPIPPGLLKEKNNILLVQVQAYFDYEMGIYRDNVALGTHEALLRDFYIENATQALSLMVYVTISGYFMLFFLRRRQERENLYFSLFLLALVGYSFFRTQYKYDFGWPLSITKRAQVLCLFATAPLFFAFIRNYFPLPRKGWIRWIDYPTIAMHLMTLACGVRVLFSDSAALYEWIINNIVQPSWIVYIVGLLVIVIRESFIDKNRDAWIMLGAITVVVLAVVLDILSGRAIINLPTLLTYAFTMFIISMALVLANRFVRLSQETERLNVSLASLNQAAQRFVPFEFLSILDKKSLLEVNLGDQVQREMTILFSDIRGFTSLSENMTPKENFDFINSYLRRVGPIVREHKGFIDKYIGDAIMALFPVDPALAVEACVRMIDTVAEWNVARARHNYGDVNVGFGLHRGRLMLGTIGENERMEGTVISDDVNLASRIESLTKAYGAQILLSEETLTGEAKGLYPARLVDRVRVKGKTAPVTLVEIIAGGNPETLKPKLDTLKGFAEGVAAYQAGKIQEARSAFVAIYKQNQNDRAVKVYIKRCDEFLKNGIPEGWDGVETLYSK
ncbi:MAG: adenylate/guanylate cyclase domain-containing protein [Leptospirales bacterium]|nr:adenylate/guanylate cyclase domain-containing protein [Leptospirales bacterium]